MAEDGITYTSGRRTKKNVSELTAQGRWHRRNPGRNNAHVRQYRADAIAFLGSTCRRCGFTDARALQIDHVRSNGSEERRALTPTAIYKRVLVVPDDYQLLCANCNYIKRSVENECRWLDA